MVFRSSPAAFVAGATKTLEKGLHRSIQGRGSLGAVVGDYDLAFLTLRIVGKVYCRAHYPILGSTLAP